MPTAGDHLPVGPTDMARRVAALEREVRELRAARRAAHTTVTTGSTRFIGASGWELILDPSSELPIIYFRDPEGAEMAALNTTGETGRPGYNLSSGLIPDDIAPDWRWVTFGGAASAGDNFVTARFQDSDVNRQLGGWLYLGAGAVQFGTIDTAAGAHEILQIGSGSAVFDRVRMRVAPLASASPGLTVATAAGHTGTVFTLTHNGSTIATVNTAGAATFAGQVTAQDLDVGGAVTKTGATWQNPSFAATWATGGNLGGNSTFRGLQFRRTAEDEVWVIGAAVSSGTGTTIATLPVGYRPPTNKRALLRAYFSSGSSVPVTGWAQVTEAGAIAVGASISGYSVASGTQVWLDGKFPLGNLT
ncbi:hypothetical protein ACWGDX_03115 [Streptomyces sp. NPDC055025]